MEASTLPGDDRNINVAYPSTIHVGLGSICRKTILRSVQAREIDFKSDADAQQSGHVESRVIR
jgi:hypothetical protein